MPAERDVTMTDSSSVVAVAVVSAVAAPLWMANLLASVHGSMVDGPTSFADSPND